jgi:hypothetical protein
MRMKSAVESQFLFTATYAALLSGALRLLDHAERQAILDGSKGIECLDLDVQIRVCGHQPIDLHEAEQRNTGWKRMNTLCRPHERS